MKIKKGRLQQIIREELTRVLSEEADSDGDGKLGPEELRRLAAQLDKVDVVKASTGQVLSVSASVVNDFLDDPGRSALEDELIGTERSIELNDKDFDDLDVYMEKLNAPKRRSPEELYAELESVARGGADEIGGDDLSDGAKAILDGYLSDDEQQSLINHLFEPGADEETLINHTIMLMQKPEEEE